MNANLTSLATELVEEIVQYLDFYDIASLRLTCRILEQKASYGKFTTYVTVVTLRPWRVTIRQ